MANLKTEIRAILESAGLDPREALWNHKQSGRWIAYHAACEKAAAAKGIRFDPPTIVQADAEKKLAVVLVTGRLGDVAEWSFGEAAPYNTQQTYPFAMAEKRAKDRVILKLLGLHGEVYSEVESDEFPNTEQPEKPAASAKPAPAPETEIHGRLWPIFDTYGNDLECETAEHWVETFNMLLNDVKNAGVLKVLLTANRATKAALERAHQDDDGITDQLVKLSDRVSELQAQFKKGKAA